MPMTKKVAWAATPRDYLRLHIDGIQHVHMLTWSRGLAALGEFCLWVVPAVAFVLAVSWLESFRRADYLQAAISQGIGPELWNVIGCFGFSLFGLALLWPRARITRLAAHHVLANAFGIGALTFGLLLGQSIVAIAGATVEAWQAWFFGVSVTLLFLISALFNLAAWYGALLTSPAAQQDGGFLHWWSGRPLLLRGSLALLLMLLPIALLIAER
jgi:hypothetical protein